MEFCPNDESELEEYLWTVSGTAPLTSEEEKQLGYRVEQGDSEARERLVRANLHLVVAMARRYAKEGASFLKLLEPGTLGLLIAVEAFDPQKDASLAEGANKLIAETIQKSLGATPAP